MFDMIILGLFEDIEFANSEIIVNIGCDNSGNVCRV